MHFLLSTLPWPIVGVGKCQTSVLSVGFREMIFCFYFGPTHSSDIKWIIILKIVVVCFFFKLHVKCNDINHKLHHL